MQGRKSVLTPDKQKHAFKVLQRSLQILREQVVFVEGRRDREALAQLGCGRVYTISGNLRISCRYAAEEGADEVVVLTDLDRRGAEMLERACEELQRYSIRCNRDVRLRLGKVLHVKYFEHLARAWESFLEENG